MFYCVSAADYGGDSPVVFNRDIKKGLETSEVYEKMKNKKIRYIRNLSHEKNSPYLTWQETFKTKSEEVSLNTILDLNYLLEYFLYCVLYFC